MRPVAGYTDGDFKPAPFGNGTSEPINGGVQNARHRRMPGFYTDMDIDMVCFEAGRVICVVS